MPGPPVTIGCAVVLTPGAAGAPDSGVITTILQSIATASGMPLATVGSLCQMVNSISGVPYVLPIGQGGSGSVSISGQALVRVGDQIPSGPGVLMILGPPAAPFINDQGGALMATRDINQINQLMGTDLRLHYGSTTGFFEDGDLDTVRDATRSQGERDLATAGGIDNLTQALANRLKTRKGELAPLGHPDYGSRHHELIGEPNVDRTRNLIKLYVLQALRDEPRIEKVISATVRAEHSPPRDTVRIELELRVIGIQTPLNLIVPFSLGGAV